MAEYRMGAGTALAETLHARIEHVMEIINIKDRSIAGLIRFRAYEYMRYETRHGREYWTLTEIVGILRRESYLQRKGFYPWIICHVN